MEVKSLVKIVILSFIIAGCSDNKLNDPLEQMNTVWDAYMEKASKEELESILREMSKQAEINRKKPITISSEEEKDIVRCVLTHIGPDPVYIDTSDIFESNVKFLNQIEAERCKDKLELYGILLSNVDLE